MLFARLSPPSLPRAHSMPALSRHAVRALSVIAQEEIEINQMGALLLYLLQPAKILPVRKSAIQSDELAHPGVVRLDCNSSRHRDLHCQMLLQRSTGASAGAGEPKGCCADQGWHVTRQPLLDLPPSRLSPSFPRQSQVSIHCNCCRLSCHVHVCRQRLLLQCWQLLFFFPAVRAVGPPAVPVLLHVSLASAQNSALGLQIGQCASSTTIVSPAGRCSSSAATSRPPRSSARARGCS